MKVEIDIEYKPTVEEIAQEIWELDAEKQLYLLYELATVCADRNKILMQMQAMREEVVSYGDEITEYQYAKKFIGNLNDYLNGGE